MSESTKTEQENRGGTDSLTDLIRTGAQQLLAQALKPMVGGHGEHLDGDQRWALFNRALAAVHGSQRLASAANKARSGLLVRLYPFVRQQHCNFSTMR